MSYSVPYWTGYHCLFFKKNVLSLPTKYNKVNIISIMWSFHATIVNERRQFVNCYEGNGEHIHVWFYDISHSWIRRRAYVKVLRPFRCAGKNDIYSRSTHKGIRSNDIYLNIGGMILTRFLNNLIKKRYVWCINILDESTLRRGNNLLITLLVSVLLLG